MAAGLRAALSRRSARLDALADAERDQLPLWLPVGLGLGTAAWFVLPSAPAWTAFLLFAGGTAAACFAAAAETRWARALALFWLAALIGCANIWWKAERVAAPVLRREGVATFDATVESLQRLPAEEIVRLVVKVDRRGAAARLPERIRLNLDEEKAPPDLEAEAIVAVRAWLMPPPPPAVPGAYDFARAAWFQRLGATARALEVTVTDPPRRRGWRARLASARQSLADHVRRRLPGGEGGIAAALATGDQGGIPEADAEAMRRSGLAHLLSVSGLHLTAVVGAVMLLTLKLLALSPALALRFRLVVIAAGVGAAAGIAYTLFTGAEVPTIRSCIAAILVLAGIALGRDALTLRLVAVGALIVLLVWPESLVGPSFQMSFAAIVAIVVLHDHPRVRAFVARRDEALPLKLLRLIAGLVLTGLAVELALIPIALFHFHQAGLYGALANIVAIPLTTFVIMPLEALALAADPLGLSAPFWWLAGRALAFLLWLAHAVAAAPGAVAMLPALPRGAFACLVAGGLWLALWRTRWRIAGLLPILAGAAWALATPAPDLLVTGDGAHLAVRTGDGLAILRPRAGDYVRDTLSENAGIGGEPRELESLAGASCSPDLCAAEVIRHGTRWRVLATRSPYLVDFDPLRRACAEADIVVSDRRLPVTCRPRWLKADRALLARTGGLSIVLGKVPEVTTVASFAGEHPWAVR
ncbi:ComEC/Rec2 family competence protein [Sphingomonas parva]|uniref:ComEC/Rec2 family competence protein n=1 Tax=Sphingomonas parva TaxID=2555898 RepID=UPI001CDB8B2D|nr:ComEC/Rec2 family competence protein [Sphingomonas parva]